jgi:hypothetical protein
MQRGESGRCWPSDCVVSRRCWRHSMCIWR